MVFGESLNNKQMNLQIEHTDFSILIEKLKGDNELTEIYQLTDEILKTYSQGLHEFQGMNHTQSLLAVNVLSELKGMVSFTPGRLEGIEPVVSLLEWVASNPSVEALDLYKRDEWKHIVELSGPVETVMRVKCEKCGNIYYSMGISGFLDMSAMICRECGDVYFKSYYDNSEVPKCLCGGDYQQDCCPVCNSIDRKMVGELSPYEYFYSHKYIKGNLISK